MLYRVSSATSDFTRYLQISRLISSVTCIFWWSNYLFPQNSGTRENVIHKIISSIICHVRLYQIFAEITPNLVIYLYLLIFNIPLYLLDIIMCKTFLPVQNKYTASLFYMPKFWKNRWIDNLKTYPSHFLFTNRKFYCTNNTSST